MVVVVPRSRAQVEENHLADFLFHVEPVTALQREAPKAKACFRTSPPQRGGRGKGTWKEAARLSVRCVASFPSQIFVTQRGARVARIMWSLLEEEGSEFTDNDLTG